MTYKINLIEKTQRKNIESNVNSNFMFLNSENYYLHNKNQSEIGEIFPTNLVKNSFVCENPTLHDKILFSGINNFRSSLQKDAQKFGAKPNQLQLINLITGSKFDQKSFVNYLDTKFYSNLGL